MRREKKILIVDDEPSIRLVLSKVVERKGYVARTVSSVGEAEAVFSKEEPFFAAFLDIRLPDGSGLELLGRIRHNRHQCPCVVMTADATMDNAVKAVKKGAFEYLVKPLDMDEVEQILERIEHRHALAKTAHEDVSAFAESGDFEIIGRSPFMQKLFKKIGRAAASNFTALVTGESGSGKELVARNLHEFSDRAGKPFVTINCSAIPKDLMESELFGHVKGAFTGADRDRTGILEEADGGTLFMDEIGEISPKTQVKLLRLLEEGKITPVGGRKSVPIDIRFVTATNRNLEEMVKQGLFREDLFHRLNVIPIHVPPLKSRSGDISLLAAYFVKRHGGGRRISHAALEELEKRGWPGNVRQLQNAVKRALVMTSDETLLPEHFSKGAEETPEEMEEWIARMMENERENIHGLVMARVEKELLRLALEKCGGNKIRAAKLLGINRNTLTKKARDFSL
jgi:two-component system nitrogen regulation response regulator GlnG